MPFKFPYLTAVFSCMLILQATAQDKLDVKYGKISVEDFQNTYKVDSGASAVVLFDIGSTDFQADGAWFQLVFKRHRRVKIINKNGYDAANEAIGVYVSGMNEERLSNLKGATYNLVDGKLETTELEEKSVFTDKYTKKHSLKKFTMPNVREGSIIEYSYTITSDFLFNLQSWEFQSADYPILWSEYKVSIPAWTEYIFLKKGYLMEAIPNTPSTSARTFTFRQASEAIMFNIPLTTHRWVYKDVPALKEEDFTTTMDNHITSIRFQQSAVRVPNQPIKPIMSTWPVLYEEYMKSENAGAVLKDNNFFLDGKVKELTAGVTTDQEKAQLIFNFVRDNYTCTGHSSLYLQGSLKNIFNKKNGNVSEINLLLTAMLNKAGLTAYPMILSTRNNGAVYAFYPIIDMFNYTVCAFKNGDNYLYLDASYPYLGFGKLDVSCYNGHARILNENVEPRGLFPDSLKERKMTTVMITPDDKGHLKAIWKQTPTYLESCLLRERIKQKGEEAYFKDAAKTFTGEVELKNGKINNLKEMDQPLGIEYEFDAQDDPKADVLYFSPMFSEAYKYNPFKSADRAYPVEMPYTTDESLVMAIIVPEGYEADELPKSVRVNYGEDDGFFEYLVANTGTSIQMRCRIKMNRATFEPGEYNDLRSFYEVIVKKQAEQIVLKKKK